MTTTPKITKEEKVLIEARDRLHELAGIQAAAREEELKIRDYIANKYSDKPEGASTLTVGTTKFTVTTKVNRSITKAEAERLCNENGPLAEAALNWTPTVRGGVVKAHPELEEYITTTQAPATVSFK